MMITMFKSVIESSPILFVKIGQEQVGAIDFQLIVASNSSLVNSDYNPYTVDPFKNMLLVENQNTTISNSTTPTSGVVAEASLSASKKDTRCPPIFDSSYTAIRVCDDHILIGDFLPIFRVKYFE